MLSTYIQTKKDEEGFTLIELLVVVIIIGILAAIAIPVFLSQRQNAWDSSAQSTLRSAGVALESYRTENGTYVESSADGLLTDYGMPTTDPDAVELTVVDPDVDSFCVQAKHDSSTNWWHIDESGAAADTGDCTP